ncbi:MAG: hypothetical protein OEW04_14980 [Nitrospirota bacterium]|nr:hypothetical protein [Nitrospirota bacterium]
MSKADDLLKKSAFVIGYDEKGDQIDVVEGEGYSIIENGDGPVPTELISRVKEKLKSKEEPGADGFPIEVKTTSILHIGTKSCYVIRLATGGYRVICG